MTIIFKVSQFSRHNNAPCCINSKEHLNTIMLKIDDDISVNTYPNFSLLISLGRNRLAHSPKNISNQGGPSSSPSADACPQDNRENIYLDLQYREKRIRQGRQEQVHPQGASRHVYQKRLLPW